MQNQELPLPVHDDAVFADITLQMRHTVLLESIIGLSTLFHLVTRTDDRIIMLLFQGVKFFRKEYIPRRGRSLCRKE
jgi:hypothetical protein